MAENHEVIEVEVIRDGEEASGSDENAGKISVSTSHPCKLCLDEITTGNKFTMEACGCFFCTDCMKTYVAVLIKDGVALSITCPDSECVIQGALQIHEVEALVDRDTFEKYLRMKYEQEVAVDPNRTFCPNPNCSNVCYLYSIESMTYKQMKKKQKEVNANAQLPINVSCPSCHLEFCHICKTEWSEGHKCNDPTTAATSIGGEISKFRARAGLLSNSQADAVIKRCPVCNVLIEKDRGCAQMICKNCSHVFCWYCLKLLDNDFMLRHYDKGPCKNFLGHSRSQVMRHRLGVIGLFAAFSLLLVVALPILILAAPVFLCCKWKECCERAWRRAQQENNNALFEELEREMQKYSNGNRSSVEVVSEVQSRNSQDPALPPEESTPPEDSQSPPVAVIEAKSPEQETEPENNEPPEDETQQESM